MSHLAPENPILVAILMGVFLVVLLITSLIAFNLSRVATRKTCYHSAVCSLCFVAAPWGLMIIVMWPDFDETLGLLCLFPFVLISVPSVILGIFAVVKATEVIRD